MAMTEMPMIPQLRSQIESILLVIDNPVTPATLAAPLGVEPLVVTDVLREISAEYDERGSGFDLRETKEGWRLYTRVDNADAVEKFLLDGSQTRLSRAALETLAVVAYRQPVTRAQVSAVRGVNVDGVEDQLLGAGKAACDENEVTIAAVAGQLIEQQRTTMGFEELSQLIKDSARSGIC